MCVISSLMYWLDTIYLAIDHDIIVLIAYDVKDIRFLLLNVDVE